MRTKTVFHLCEAHTDRLMQFGPKEAAKLIVEGGPSGGACRPQHCEIRPGRDYYAEWVDDAEMQRVVADWAVNRKAESSEG